ncbi:Acyl-CoA carboxylase subunit beta [Sulfidibacter corallicola]|uniref:Acyl-CoA carboxylase subunit beta n=1 Tax=Sulfidibacter corallicola TaxID=2818388 RepID=A0A8A4TJX3_SULCO|nr:carboxyl transferase domain-containing protein [Sulfidibacter corallicola]QTD49883.1 acyl-CoA carboxylase subunit beta [Sulfidibacter corallicola]
MTILDSHIDVAGDLFRQNRDDMLAEIARFREAEARLTAREEKARPKFAKRGQLLPRERIALLLDPGTPFLELFSLAGYRRHDDRDGSEAGGGVISGIGYVSGVRCMVMASNSAVKGGAISPAGLQKNLRCQQIALENRLPLVFLVESAGANLTYQSEVFIEGGRGFANQARLSAAGIPQITIVHGSSTAGGAYIPGLSDYVIMVRKAAKVFLAGPPLLRAATGEIATDEDLGGADMHGREAGTAEFLAEDDRDAVRIARDVVAGLGWPKADGTPRFEESRPPRYAIEELVGVVPIDFKRSYDVREVIARIVDDSRFTEFKEAYEHFTICGRAEIQGRVCGLIGNNGPITTKGAVKAAQFIQLCCQSGTPLVYLQNTTGYMVGTEAERGGIVKHGSKMIQAVANATVPQITLVIGGSFGAGNYGMCGRGMDPRFIFSWPNARVGVMGAEQAAKVMSIITAAKAKRGGLPMPPQHLEAMERQIIARMREESDVMFGSARLWDDGIIDPRDSRKVLAFLLSICAESESRPLHANSFGVARM